MNDWHDSHIPTEPRNIGFSVGVVYCRACGAVLRSARGIGTAEKVTLPCVPITEGFRDAAPSEGRGPLGF